MRCRAAGSRNSYYSRAPEMRTRSAASLVEPAICLAIPSGGLPTGQKPNGRAAAAYSKPLAFITVFAAGEEMNAMKLCAPAGSLPFTVTPAVNSK